jgi:hypothetical protein
MVPNRYDDRSVVTELSLKFAAHFVFPPVNKGRSFVDSFRASIFADPTPAPRFNETVASPGDQSERHTRRDENGESHNILIVLAESDADDDAGAESHPYEFRVIPPLRCDDAASSTN